METQSKWGIYDIGQIEISIAKNSEDYHTQLPHLTEESPQAKGNEVTCLRSLVGYGLLCFLLLPILASWFEITSNCLNWLYAYMFSSNSYHFRYDVELARQFFEI